MSIEDSDSKKIEQQKLEQQETDKLKTGKEALDLVKAQKEGKEVTENLETSAEQPLTGKDTLDSIKQERQNVTEKLETSSINNEIENVEKQKSPSETRWDKNWSEHLQNHRESAVRERFDTAYQFYKEAGLNHEQTLDHMKGINFNREVSVETIKSEEVLKQYQTPESNQAEKIGSYFSKISEKGELGIQGEYTGEQNRVSELYVVNKELRALRSTSADIDSWKGTGEMYYGGGEQYFIAKEDVQESLSRWNKYRN